MMLQPGATAFRLALPVLLMAVLGGCGFQLRSYALDTNLQSFFVDGPRQHFLHDPLTQGCVRLALNLRRRQARPTW